MLPPISVPILPLLGIWAISVLVLIGVMIVLLPTSLRLDPEIVCANQFCIVLLYNTENTVEVQNWRLTAASKVCCTHLTCVH